jgi:tRNA threonylcarbamoyl adenosine modification protein (Sua5/YciO/YrdC/YwlC family)
MKAVEILSYGGIIIYPTDTVYGIGCDIFKQKSVEKIARIKGVNPKKPDFSFICHDMSDLADYVLPLNNHLFKLMKKNLPGPFTFILPASNRVPKLFKGQKKTIGIRIPDNNIIREIVRELKHPIISTSVHDPDEIIDYTTDPELIYEKYRNEVDLVINGGYGGNEPSTVVDCTGDNIEILRQGLGILQE